MMSANASGEWRFVSSPRSAASADQAVRRRAQASGAGRLLRLGRAQQQHLPDEVAIGGPLGQVRGDHLEELADAARQWIGLRRHGIEQGSELLGPLARDRFVQLLARLEVVEERANRHVRALADLFQAGRLHALRLEEIDGRVDDRRAAAKSTLLESIHRRGFGVCHGEHRTVNCM